MPTVKISDVSYKLVIAWAGKLQTQQGRIVSVSEALDNLLLSQHDALECLRNKKVE